MNGFYDGVVNLFMSKHIWIRVKSDKIIIRNFRCKGCGRTVRTRWLPDGSYEDPIKIAEVFGHPMHCPRPHPSLQDLQKLWEDMRSWVDLHKVRTRESIMQVDSIVEFLPELAESVCEYVGFYEDLPEEPLGKASE